MPTLPEVTAAMQSAGKTFTSEVYPGTGHGFLKPGRQGPTARRWRRRGSGSWSSIGQDWVSKNISPHPERSRDLHACPRTLWPTPGLVR